MRKRTHIQLVFVLLLGLMATGASAQSFRSLVRKGNKLYDQKKYSEAEVLFRKAQAKNPKYAKSTFNLGDAVYQEKNFKGAEKYFQNLAQQTRTPAYQPQSWYNLGNTYMSQKQYEKSIASYIQSLLRNPTDMNAKYNLTYARKMLRKKKQQKKKNKQNKKQNKKNQNKKNNKNQNKKKNQQNKNQQNKGGRKKQQISPQDAQRILNALRNSEKNTLRKLEKERAKAIKAKSYVINW